MILIAIASTLMILTSVALFAVFIPLPKLVERFFLLRVLLALIIMLALFQAEAFVFWLMQLQIPAFVYPSVTLVGAAVLSYSRRASPVLSFSAAPSEVISILTPAVIALLVIIIVPLVQKGLSFETMVQLALLGVDDVSHLKMFTDIAINDSGLGSGLGYPEGWHQSMTVLARCFSLPGTGATLEYYTEQYYGTKALTLFIAMLSISILLATLHKKLSAHRPPKMTTCIGLAVVSTFISSVVVISSYGMGHYNFMAVIALVCLCVSLFVSFDNGVDEKMPLIVILSLLGLSSMFCWVLSAPLIYCLALVSALRHMSGRGAIRQWLCYLMPVGLSGILALIFVLRYILSVNSIADVSLPGGIATPTILLSIIVFCAALYIAFRQKGSVALGILVPLALLVILAAYFTAKGMPLNLYYFLKYEMYTFTPIASIVFCKLVISAEGRIYWQTSLILVLALLFVPLAGGAIVNIDRDVVLSQSPIVKPFASVLKEHYEKEYPSESRELLLYFDSGGLFITELYSRVLSLANQSGEAVAHTFEYIDNQVYGEPLEPFLEKVGASGHGTVILYTNDTNMERMESATTTVISIGQ